MVKIDAVGRLAEDAADEFVKDVYLPEDEGPLRDAFISGARWAYRMLDAEGALL